MFFDSHCHLDFELFAGEQGAILRQASQLGVSQLLVPGVTAEQWPHAIALAAKHPQHLYVALGLHPFWLSEHRQQHLVHLEQQLQQRPACVVAIGECGLDAVLAPEQMPWQLELLEAQLQLAQRYQLPVILHVRKAHPQLQQLLKKYPKVNGVVHGFSGSYQLALSYVKLGFKLGVGGTITYPRAQKTCDAMARLPLSALVLETDAPSMPLAGHQGQRNSPEYLPQIFAALCQLRAEPAAQLRTELWRNTLSLFALNQGLSSR